MRNLVYMANTTVTTFNYVFTGFFVDKSTKKTFVKVLGFHRDEDNCVIFSRKESYIPVKGYFNFVEAPFNFLDCITVTCMVDQANKKRWATDFTLAKKCPEDLKLQLSAYITEIRAEAKAKRQQNASVAVSAPEAKAPAAKKSANKKKANKPSAEADVSTVVETIGITPNTTLLG